MVPVKRLWLYSMMDRSSPAGHSGRAPVSWLRDTSSTLSLGTSVTAGMLPCSRFWDCTHPLKRVETLPVWQLLAGSGTAHTH